MTEINLAIITIKFIELKLGKYKEVFYVNYKQK